MSDATVPAVYQDAGSGGWDEEFDVVVAGAGAAGHAAAIAAADAGSSVLVCERAGVIGGTTSKSRGGAFWIPGNSLMRAAGLDDPREDAIRYMARVAYPMDYRAEDPTLGLQPGRLKVISAFYDRAGPIVDRLVALSAIDAVMMDVPDYHAHLAEDAAPRGRALLPAGDVMAVGGGSGGEALIGTLSAAAARMGVDTRVEHRIVGLVRDSPHGPVSGVQVATSDGILRIRARGGVVFGTGGFLHDAQLCRDHLRGPILGGCAVETCTGDFVRIGAAAGAELGTMQDAWWSDVILEHALESRAMRSAVTFNFGDSMIYVDKRGRRVVNEKSPYADRGRVYHEWDAGTREYRNALLFMIYDDSVAYDDARGYARDPVPHPSKNRPWVISGKDVAELTERIDARLRQLHDTIGRVSLAPRFAQELARTLQSFADFARTGEDLDHRRGAEEIDRAFHYPDRGAGLPNPTMHPFGEDSHLHAIIIGPGALDTKGGPRTDEDGRVVDGRGDVIHGLYGAGNCVAAVSGEGYWGAGGTIGPALVFGYSAGAHAAARSMALRN